MASSGLVGSELTLERAWSGRLELVRYADRRRVAALAISPGEVAELAHVLSILAPELEVEEKAVAAGTRAPGPGRFNPGERLEGGG